MKTNAFLFETSLFVALLFFVFFVVFVVVWSGLILVLHWLQNVDSVVTKKEKVNL
jgi:hypothetical protein